MRKYFLILIIFIVLLSLIGCTCPICDAPQNRSEVIKEEPTTQPTQEKVETPKEETKNHKLTKEEMDASLRGKASLTKEEMDAGLYIVWDNNYYRNPSISKYKKMTMKEMYETSSYEQIGDYTDGTNNNPDSPKYKRFEYRELEAGEGRRGFY